MVSFSSGNMPVRYLVKHGRKLTSGDHLDQVSAVITPLGYDMSRIAATDDAMYRNAVATYHVPHVRLRSAILSVFAGAPMQRKCGFMHPTYGAFCGVQCDYQPSVTGDVVTPHVGPHETRIYNETVTWTTMTGQPA